MGRARRKVAPLGGSPDLWGYIAEMEPTRLELIAAQLNRIRTDRYCVCGCGRWLIAGEETEINDSEFQGPLSLPCALAYGYVQPRERKQRQRRSHLLDGASGNDG